jgi:hypothetical protein
MRLRRAATPALAWTLLFSAAAAALAIVVLPAWYVQPFSPQTEQGLDRALALREVSPMGTVAAAALCIVLAAALWRGAGRWPRVALLALPALALVAAGLARFNHFEAMFEPLTAPQFAPTRDVDFVADEDMVIAVENEGDAVAFPVRQMAYHHVIQELVGGVAVVATY